MSMAFWQITPISIHALREEGDPTAWWPLLPGTHFYPRPPRGGRPSTALLCQSNRNFYPRPPRGGRPSYAGTSPEDFKFLSTPSARRATKPETDIRIDKLISIHALREEGDLEFLYSSSDLYLFLSTPSARRATAYDLTMTYPIVDFYPRPPRGGRPSFLVSAAVCFGISIHALREEGD